MQMRNESSIFTKEASGNEGGGDLLVELAGASFLVAQVFRVTVRPEPARILSVTETGNARDIRHNIKMPADVNTGDVLIIVIMTENVAVVTVPSGWERYNIDAE